MIAPSPSGSRGARARGWARDLDRSHQPRRPGAPVPKHGSDPAREPTTVVWREQAIAEITPTELAVDWLTSTTHQAPRLDAETADRGATASARRVTPPAAGHGVPFAVTVVKLPSGALTAALGLLLMRADFVPGLSALDSPAQIIGWAIVFGYAQQLFTRLVDQRAQTVLDGAGSESVARDATGAARASAAR